MAFYRLFTSLIWRLSTIFASSSSFELICRPDLWLAPKLIWRRIVVCCFTRQMTPPVSANNSVSPTVKTASPETASRISARLSCSDELMKQDVAPLQRVERLEPLDYDPFAADRPTLQDIKRGAKRVLPENPNDERIARRDRIRPFDELREVVDQGGLHPVLDRGRCRRLGPGHSGSRRETDQEQQDHDWSQHIGH